MICNRLTSFFVFCSWILLPLTGCSYSFSGANLGGLKTVAIPVFENLTSEPNIRERVSGDLTKAILDDNNLKISDVRQADAVLFGRITKFEDVPFAFDQAANNTFTTSDYKVTIIATIRFENRKEKKIVWEESVTGWGRYSAQGEKKRTDGIDDAIKMITQHVVNKMVSDW